LTTEGSSSRSSLISVTSPATGEYTSLAAFMLSTEPKLSLWDVWCVCGWGVERCGVCVWYVCVVRVM
jgi:hypothetical protein